MANEQRELTKADPNTLVKKIDDVLLQRNIKFDYTGEFVTFISDKIDVNKYTPEQLVSGLLKLLNKPKLTDDDVKDLDDELDKKFEKMGIDVKFTTHFLKQLKDERNINPIQKDELTRMYSKQIDNWGEEFIRSDSNFQGVMKDSKSKINIPFVIRKNDYDTDLIAKTIMRKNDFKTPNRVFPVESIEEDVATTQTAKKVLGQVGKRLLPVVGPALTVSDVKSGYDYLKSIPPEDRASTGKRWGDAIDSWFKSQRSAIDTKESENVELDDDKMLVEALPLLPLIALAARAALPHIIRGGKAAWKGIDAYRKGGSAPGTGGAAAQELLPYIGALGTGLADRLLGKQEKEQETPIVPATEPAIPPKPEYVGSSISFDNISDEEILNEAYDYMMELGLFGDNISQLDEEMSEKKKKKYIRQATRWLKLLKKEWNREIEKHQKDIPSSMTYDKAEKMKNDINNRQQGLIRALSSMDDKEFADAEPRLYALAKSALGENKEAITQIKSLLTEASKEISEDAELSQYLGEDSTDWSTTLRQRKSLPGKFGKIAAALATLAGTIGWDRRMNKTKPEPTPEPTKAAGTSLVEKKSKDDSTNLDINYIPQEDDCECDNESKTTEGLESEENIVYAVRSIDNGYIIFGPYDDEDQAWKDAGPMLHAVLSANQISRKTRQNIDRTGQAKISADNYERMVSEGLETGSQVKGSEARPTNSKDSGKGFNEHSYRGRLVGENFVKDIRKDLEEKQIDEIAPLVYGAGVAGAHGVRIALPWIARKLGITAAKNAAKRAGQTAVGKAAGAGLGASGSLELLDINTDAALNPEQANKTWNESGEESLNEYDQEAVQKKRMERAIIKYMDKMIDDDAQAQQAISKGGTRAKEGFMAAIRDIAFSIERRFNLEPLGIKNSRDVVRLYLTAKVDEMPDDIIPEGKYVSDAQRKAVHAAKDEKKNK